MPSISCVIPNTTVLHLPPKFSEQASYCSSNRTKQRSSPAFLGGTRSSSSRSNSKAVKGLLCEEQGASPVVRCCSSVANPKLLVRWLQSCSTKKEVKRVHAFFLKWFAGVDTHVNNHLISVYSEFRFLAYARHIFDGISEKSVVTWTAMMDGYVCCGCDDEALAVFRSCLNEGIIGNVKTFVCLLILCRRSLNDQLGRQVHACIIKGNHDNLVVNSAVLYFYARCGDLASAYNVLDRMSERDVICWTALITACSQQRKNKEALRLLTCMLDDGIMPNEFTICSVLKACGEEKQLNIGRQLHSVVAKKICKEDVFVGTCLVDMYAKCGEILDSRQVFQGMKITNTVTWTSMIAGYARLENCEAAITLFRLMKRRKIVSNNLTTVCLLKVCGTLRANLIGKEIHGQVIKNSWQNGYLDSTLVWFYCKCGDFLIASKILHQMPLRNAVSWTAIISGYAELGHESEALNFMKSMIKEGIQPNSFTCSSALKACAQLESSVEGKWIHCLASKSPSISNMYVETALIHMYARSGHVSEAMLVFDNMQERNLVSWRAMILGYLRNGLHQESLKLIYRMQDESLELDDYTLVTVLNKCADANWVHDSHQGISSNIKLR